MGLLDPYDAQSGTYMPQQPPSGGMQQPQPYNLGNMIMGMINNHLTNLSNQYAQPDPLTQDMMARFQGQPGTLTDDQRRAALGNMATGVGSLVGSVGPIRAFHGSPHDFDAFDLSKIGTGEGAQAYGHGLYFAEHEPVAQQYRDQLQWKGANFDDPQVIAQNAIDRNGDRGAAADSLESALNSTKAFYRGNVPAPQAAANAASEQAIALLRGNEPITGKPQTPGKMYEVNLHADPASLLDWDKPLSQQSPQVQDAFSKLAPNYPMFAAWEGSGALPHVRGSTLYGEVAGKGGMARGNLAGQATAAQTLNEAGIPGIQYLDAGSRGAGEGTRNYVMFNPSLIEILRKYGLAGATVGGGGLLGMQAQQ